MRGLASRLPRLPLLLLLAALSLGAALAVTGCSGGYYAAKSYTITVTGTSGNLQHSTTVTLNVQ